MPRIGDFIAYFIALPSKVKINFTLTLKRNRRVLTLIIFGNVKILLSKNKKNKKNLVQNTDLLSWLYQKGSFY